MKIWRFLVAVAILALGASACGSKPSEPSLPVGTATAPVSGRVWWSTTTGREYRLWMDKDLVHTEWVNLPPALAQGGAYVRSESRRVESKWEGTVRSYLPCETTESNTHISNRCHLETKIEIDSMTADRITGRAQAIRRFDCKACRVIEAAWADFVWIPQEQEAGGRQQ